MNFSTAENFCLKRRFYQLEPIYPMTAKLLVENIFLNEPNGCGLCLLEISDSGEGWN